MAAKDPTGSPSEPVRPKLSPRKRRRLWLFRLISVVVLPAMLFGGLELALRFAGAGYPASFLTPSEEAGYLRDNHKFALRFFPPALARSPQPIHVERKKSEDTLRIVVFGGSAAMGDPEPAVGFPRVLQATLELRHPDREFEVINAAVTAINSHVVLPIAKDCRKLKADAWVVYMGNNEVHGPFGAGTVFGGSDTPLWVIRSGLALRRLKLGQVFSGMGRQETGVPKSWGGMKMFLDHQVSHDSPALSRVYRQFGSNLGDLFSAAGKTPVIVSTVVSNLRDNAPFASALPDQLSEGQRQVWQAAFDEGIELQASGNGEAALEAFLRADALEPAHAELQYRIGTLQLEQAELATEAKARLVAARDLDGLRFRADSTVNETIRTVAEAKSVRMIDAVAVFNQLSPQGLVGADALYEHVHFTPLGNQILAKLYVEQIESACGLKSEAKWPNAAELATRLGHTPLLESQVTRQVIARLSGPPFSQQSNQQDRLELLQRRLSELQQQMTPDAARGAVENYRQQISQHPSDWTLRVLFAGLLETLNDLPAAIGEWREVVRRVPHFAEGHYQLGVLRNRAKQWEEAEASLRKAIELRPTFAKAMNSLGICLSHQGRFDESYAEFERSVAAKPDFAEGYYNWGLVLANQDDTAGAMQKFESALSVNANYLPAHLKLGKHWFSEKQLDRSVVHYQAIADGQPTDVAARTNLALLLMKMKRYEAARAEFEQVLTLDPRNQIATQALSQLP